MTTVTPSERRTVSRAPEPLNPIGVLDTVPVTFMNQTTPTIAYALGSGLDVNCLDQGAVYQ